MASLKFMFALLAVFLFATLVLAQDEGEGGDFEGGSFGGFEGGDGGEGGVEMAGDFGGFEGGDYADEEGVAANHPRNIKLPLFAKN